MSDSSSDELPPVLAETIADVIPFFERLDTGRFALGLSGSLSKGGWDEHSDIDLRLYHEHALPRPDRDSGTWREYFAIVDQWAENGVTLDGIWSRTIASVDASLDAWLSGDTTPDPIVWTIWGYHLLPDLFRQLAVLDPNGVIAGWKARVKNYPDVVRDLVLTKHLSSMRYWRDDYHYRHKVDRGDAVFLAGLSSKLVHDVIQVLCALNRVWFPGDGNNLGVVESLPVRPDSFSQRVRAVLYPTTFASIFADQYEAILALIDDTEELVAAYR